MKKIFIGLCALLASTAVMGASANKMTMVTYFPVKYVAYSQVDVTKQMDVGLTSACQMNLGCTTDEGFNTGKSLRVNNLLKIAGGKLELNDAPAIVGTTAVMGSGNSTADFDFETNLRVANYKQGYTLQADNMYLSELNLFGYKFPACSGETMSWQKLKLKNKDEVYLVCGEAEKGETGCANQPLSTSKLTLCSEVYGSGYSGSIRYKWNSDTCAWDKTSENCTRSKTRYLTYPSNCLRYCSNTSADGVQFYPVKCLSPEDYRYNCALNVSEITFFGVEARMPDGCQPGKACATCEIGKQYVVGYEYSFCVGKYHSLAVVTCYEGPDAPQPGNLNCANVDPGQGGSSGITVAPAN